ncbi:sigma-70 family RNA polymerase sigma factor [Nostoc sp. NMS9]|uniref:RNA polymerase sigma factor n=1 Tax=Nostoc sp. NMS9 TaxID=2815393 RepID=UPI0025E66F1B|nr:sigma-70 family RNA polymerase sigma factor [Nostoc sp. NMS9]MBN3940007.1 sigma-70 family RNA polymerase sigma factor [Nostoc sp. NMS9]
MSNCQSVVASVTSCLRNNSEDKDLVKRFWQQWQEYRDYLHRCCLKWMGGNPTDAEDALSRAMLKAWEKVQKYAEEIANFKAWLTRLTHNLCVDIHRERDRSTNRVENIEVYASKEEQGLVRSEETPESAMETGEKRIVIRRAIDNLPTRLRETFILHFYQELSYQEIVQQQEISYQNVCKRISLARAILREELRGYFIGEDGIDTDKSVTPTMEVTESAIGEMSKGNAGVEPIAIKTMTLSVAVEEVESVVGEESIEVVRSVIATLSDGKLDVNKDGYRCVEVAKCELPPAPILTLAQLDEETGSWGNSCLVVHKTAFNKTEQEVEKIRQVISAEFNIIAAQNSTTTSVKSLLVMMPGVPNADIIVNPLALKDLPIDMVSTLKIKAGLENYRWMISESGQSLQKVKE